MLCIYTHFYPHLKSLKFWKLNNKLFTFLNINVFISDIILIIYTRWYTFWTLRVVYNTKFYLVSTWVDNNLKFKSFGKYENNLKENENYYAKPVFNKTTFLVHLTQKRKTVDSWNLLLNSHISIFCKW